MRITLLAFVSLPNSQSSSSSPNTPSCAKEIVYHVAHNATVATLKQLIAVTEGIPIEEQRLLVSGITLNDSRELSDYGIKHGGTVHMVRKAPSAS